MKASLDIPAISFENLLKDKLIQLASLKYEATLIAKDGGCNADRTKRTF
jgi:hypothetical protein